MAILSTEDVIRETEDMKHCSTKGQEARRFALTTDGSFLTTPCFAKLSKHTSMSNSAAPSSPSSTSASTSTKAATWQLLPLIPRTAQTKSKPSSLVATFPAMKPCGGSLALRSMKGILPSSVWQYIWKTANGSIMPPLLLIEQCSPRKTLL